jgi:hypothetical protein
MTSIVALGRKELFFIFGRYLVYAMQLAKGSTLAYFINALRLHLFSKIELNQFINKPSEKAAFGSPKISN